MLVVDWFVFLVDGDLIFMVGFDVMIYIVVGDVEFVVYELFGEWCF